MKIKNLIDEDFVNFKLPSMLIATSKCNFKCDKECGEQICQNSALANSPTFNISDEKIIKRYLNNDITEAICIAGLEPFDTFEEVFNFIKKFRTLSNDTIVIYTGYYPSEIKKELQSLYQFSNIIIKFGRFIPNSKKRHDSILGITLASDNQFAETIEDIKRQIGVGE